MGREAVESAMRGVRFVGAAIGACILLSPGTAFAACSQGPTLAQTVQHGTGLDGSSAVILIGTVEHVGPAGTNVTPVRVRVEAVLRGHATSTVVVLNPGGCVGSICSGGSGTYGFRVGTHYVLEGHRSAGRVAIDECSEIGPVSERAANHLTSLAPSPTVYPAAAAWWPGAAAPSASGGTGLWPWLLAGAVVGVAITLITWRRRRGAARPPTSRR